MCNVLGSVNPDPVLASSALIIMIMTRLSPPACAQLLFWVDPDILEDPLMGDVRNITLSYTFFKTDEEPEESEAERAARAAAASEAGADATVGAQQRVEEWKQQTVSALGGTGAAADLVEASAATGRPAGPGGEA